MVEADDSGEFNYWLSVENRESGAWAASLTDWSTNYTYDQEEFPGSFSVEGAKVAIRIPLDTLGSPSLVRLSAITQRADHTTGAVGAEDQAPEGAQFEPTQAWLTLG